MTDPEFKNDFTMTVDTMILGLAVGFLVAFAV